MISVGSVVQVHLGPPFFEEVSARRPVEIGRIREIIVRILSFVESVKDFAKGVFFESHIL